MRKVLTPIKRRECACGCGKLIPHQRLGRKRMYLNKQHRTRAVVTGQGIDDLPAEQIEALIEQARQQLRYARVRGVER